MTWHALCLTSTLLAPAPVPEGPPARSVREMLTIAEDAKDRQAWAEAANALAEALQGMSNPNPILPYDRAVAAYRAGDMTQAAAAFERAMSASDPALSAVAAYNRGNALAKRAESQPDPTAQITDYQEALQAYRQAIQTAPPNAEWRNWAHANGELAAARLEEAQQAQAEQQQQQDQQEQSQQQQDAQDQNQQQQDSQQQQQDQNQQQQDAQDQNQQQQDSQQQSRQQQQNQSQQQQESQQQQQDQSQQPQDAQDQNQQQEGSQQQSQQQQQQQDQRQQPQNSQDQNQQQQGSQDRPQQQHQDQTQQPTEPQNPSQHRGERPPDPTQPEPRDPQGSDAEPARSNPNEQADGGNAGASPRAGDRLTRDEAQRMLQAIRDRERQRRLEQIRRDAEGTPQTGKDW